MYRYQYMSMASKSKSGSNNSKAETWEKREARLLCKAVYDHLAYYIQVQLPEEKFVSTTRLETRTLLTAVKPSDPPITGTDCAKPNGKRNKVNTRKSSISSDRKRDDAQRKPTGKQKRLSKEISTKSKRKKSHKCFDDKRVEPINEKSPYLTDSIHVRPDRTKRMRREAERVTSNASRLLRNMSLDEVMAVQKYRSPCKSLMRCSSSLSEHPNGMLTSNIAIKYAAEHDDREAARKYVEEKKKLHRKPRKRYHERERSQMKKTSFSLYQSNYRSPSKTSESSAESSSTCGSSSSDTNTSDDDISRLTSSSGTGSTKSKTHQSRPTDSTYTDNTPVSLARKEKYTGIHATNLNENAESVHVLPLSKERSNPALSHFKLHQEDNNKPDEKQHHEHSASQRVGIDDSVVNDQDITSQENVSRPVVQSASLTEIHRTDPEVIDYWLSYQQTNDLQKSPPRQDDKHLSCDAIGVDKACVYENEMQTPILKSDEMDIGKVQINETEIELSNLKIGDDSEGTKLLESYSEESRSRNGLDLQSSHSTGQLSQLDVSSQFLSQQGFIATSSAKHENSDTPDDESSSSMTSSIKRLIAGARSSLSVLGSSSDDD